MLRVKGGQDIFFGPEDRYRLYLLLQEGAERFDYRVHGFCLMTNHLHLAMQVADKPLARCMQNLSFRYTRWVNDRQGRTGHLFQGRYKAVLVEQDRHLVELVRYIHLNPVRARMVGDVHDYPWSGHGAYLGREEIPWLTTDWVLNQFGARRSVARRRYEAFIQQGLSEGYREEFHRGSKEDGRLLGSDRFIEDVLARDEVRQKPPGLDEIVAGVCEEYGIGETDLAASGQRRHLSEARAQFGWLTNELGAGTMTQAAARCHRDLSSISSGVKRLPARAEGEPIVADRMKRLRLRWQ